jgi:hypothetical protein
MTARARRRDSKAKYRCVWWISKRSCDDSNHGRLVLLCRADDFGTDSHTVRYRGQEAVVMSGLPKEKENE